MMKPPFKASNSAINVIVLATKAFSKYCNLFFEIQEKVHE